MKLRSNAVLLHDVLMAGLSFVLALYLRVGNDLQQYDAVLPIGVLLSGLSGGVVFTLAGMYRSIWRYSSVSDVHGILKAVTLAILIYVPLMFMATRLDAVPRSLPIIQWFLLTAMLIAPRFFYRHYKDSRNARRVQRETERAIPVLLVGAGDEAEAFIRGVLRGHLAGYDIIGILSVHAGRVGRQIHEVEVLGTITDLPQVIERLNVRDCRPQKLVVATDAVNGADLRHLADLAEPLGLPLTRAPRLSEFRSLDERPEVRPIALEDLLGRPQLVLDRHVVSQMIAGKRVLVTGAGGSIGSELVRQIASLGPESLALLESSEFALYKIDLEMQEKHPGLSRRAVIADVRDRDRLDQVWRDERPQVVFHAAALKHVPLVELNPAEGVLTNVIGSRNVADASLAHGVAAMVMISTDKAVNPTNVMGATKRLAEAYCQALDVADLGTRFITVRFGNVLGSTGSVVPLFQRQLAAGGPITVTHPEVVRYFMTIREAVELVLQASAHSTAEHIDQGKIYVLDMGEPVRITDLARQMIRLAGLRPDIDVKIEFTGLRPGEKLFEEIFHGSEPPVPTDQQGIMLASPRSVDRGILSAALDELERDSVVGREQRLVQRLQHLIPEFSPHERWTDGEGAAES